MAEVKYEIPGLPVNIVHNIRIPAVYYTPKREFLLLILQCNPQSMEAMYIRIPAVNSSSNLCC